MSEILITRRGILGGLKNTDAILIVSVPTGSTVTATKSGITLTPTIWVQNADSTRDSAVFIVPASTFNTTAWTIRATHGSDSTSTTLAINNNKEYSVTLSYSIPLFQNGNQYTTLTGGWTTNNYSFNNGGFKGTPTVGNVLSVVSVSGSNSNSYGVLGTANGIALGDIDSITISATISSYHNESRYYVILSTTKSLTDSNHVARVAFTGNGTKTLNVSNLSKSTRYYISVLSYVTSSVATYSSTFNVSSIIGKV